MGTVSLNEMKHNIPKPTGTDVSLTAQTRVT